MKKILVSFLAAMLLTTTAGAVDLYVDMTKIDTDTPPTLVDGRTLVPVRAIFEAIGATVEWDNDTRTATGVRGDTTVVIQIDNTTAYVNGEARTLDVPAQLINDRTMVPARFISEAMGCEVTWYDATKTAAVADKLKGQHIYVTKTGSKYHYSGTCNGGTYYEATLAEATGRGLTPCDKCVLTAEGSPATAPAPQAPAVTLPDLTGEWKQVNSNSDTSWQSATISADTIEIYWISDNGNTTALYWAGTYTAPQTGGELYTWESANDHAKTDLALLASGDDTKTFTYQNGQLCYSVSALGVTTTVKLEKVQ